MNNRTRFIVGFLAGSAVGLTLAILFAPKSGAELRGSITDGIDDLKQRATDKYAEKKAQIEEVARNLKATSDDIAVDLKTTVDHGKKIVS